MAPGGATRDSDTGKKASGIPGGGSERSRRDGRCLKRNPIGAEVEVGEREAKPFGTPRLKVTEVALLA